MNKKSYYIFGIAFLIFIIAVFLYLTSIGKMKQYVEMVTHTQDVIASFEKISGEIKSAQMIPSETGKNHKNALLLLYRTDLENIPTDIERLKKLVFDNKPQLKRV
jgi:CHASE3 domain sensor protein